MKKAREKRRVREIERECLILKHKNHNYKLQNWGKKKKKNKKKTTEQTARL